MEIINFLYILTSSVYILYLPGLMVSYVFFEKGKIDLIERIALSFALSISTVPLLVFYLNLLGVKITRVSVILDVLFIILVSAVVRFIKNGKNTKTNL
ncbi:hypothetical protein A2716_04335 [candidate division WWE3 bacterium RIFCSPHIGHO2_01_FULL_40_23]|uniref:DUF1616 domain-containing protein n=1 Tax=candidate division WWE3 bacterium RIFCSPLOWO2_01_FULL_41_18 TaxID=1802625 RepID=A0A1F4VCX7_UNCKA|nr:MAG: hypothetical protein A2716_04335 [candidate division WWE3 bacterium RIFCSPHIGHO2_01_FULL_40_23]OGC55102.1 MAG: hypothetical protein A3A78_03945 [candidate division WWE3 bacterium RIFCSPLOWO2_01_FULL_41_18]